MKPGHAMSLGDVTDLTFASRPIGCKTQFRKQILLPGIEPRSSNRLESFVLDSGRTLYVPNTVIRRDLQTSTVKEEIRCYSSQYSARLSAHTNGPVVNFIQQPDNRSLGRPAK
jgi:hypothetical protein